MHTLKELSLSMSMYLLSTNSGTPCNVSGAMTVTYVHDVQTAKGGTFARLLMRWKGGIFKGIWLKLLIYLGLYGTISLTYRFSDIHNDTPNGNKFKMVFERFCVFTSKYGDMVPMSFILGFYVSQVVSRWWTQVMAIPWLDSLCMDLATYIPGRRAKNTRRLITRWAILANILTLRKISCNVLKRFPNYEHLIETGLMTEREMKKLQKLDELTEDLHATTWYPIHWAQEAVRKAKDEGLFTADIYLKELQNDLKAISSGNGTLLVYAWINIPLVYTQLVTIVVYIYFFVTLFSRQYLIPDRFLEIESTGAYTLMKEGHTDSVNLVGYDDSIVDYYIPIFTIIEFVFYVGWLNVAETLLNPFGDDDDDIDCNYIIDRNFQIGYFMVSTEEDDEEPEEDTYGDSIPPPTLPHTVSSAKHKEAAPVFLTDTLHLSEEAMRLNNPDHPAFSQVRNSVLPTPNHSHTSINLEGSEHQTEEKEKIDKENNNPPYTPEIISK